MAEKNEQVTSKITYPQTEERQYEVADSVTGKVFVGTKDEILAQLKASGIYNPERTETTETQPIMSGHPLQEMTLGPEPDLRQKFYNYFGKYVKPGLTTSGGVIGGIMAPEIGQSPIVGRAAGTVLGSSSGDVLQQLAPSLFGQYYPSSLTSEIGKKVGEVALNEAMEVPPKIIGAGFPSVRDAFYAKMLGQIFKPTIPTRNIEALRADPNFPVSVGQTSSFGNWVENQFGHAAKDEFIKDQQERLAHYVSQFRKPVGDIMTEARQEARVGRIQMRGQKKQLYNTFEQNIPANSKDVQVKIGERPSTVLNAQGQPTMMPVYKNETIEGAIPLNNAASFVKDVGDQLDETIGPTLADAQNVGAGTGHPLSGLKFEIDKLRNIAEQIDPATGAPLSQPIASYRRLQGIRDNINRYLANKKSLGMPPRMEASLEALRKTIDLDINNGIRGWGPTEFKQYRTAQDYAAKMARRFNPELSANLLNAGKTGKQTLLAVGRDALSDPQKIEEFINVTGRKDLARDLYLNGIVDKSWDNATGGINPDKALRLIEANRAVGKKAVPSRVLSNAEQFLLRAQTVKPLGEHSGAAWRWTLNGGITLSSALTLGMLGRDIPERMAIAGSTVMLTPFAAKRFINRVMLNPEMARAGIKLQSVSGRSEAAKIAMNTARLAMKGLQIQILTPKGDKKFMTMGEDGKFYPSNEKSEHEESDTENTEQ